MEYGGGGGGSGGDHDSADSHTRKKRYHRHTAHQIQRLEATFKECPHPDEKQRLQLSRELGLAPRQIKFWFQNRRTQMKAQHERADNCALRDENDKIRCENIVIKEALKNAICPSCGGGPPIGEDSYFDEQKLRVENAQLKEEAMGISEMDKSLMADFAANALEELLRLLQTNEPLWMKSPTDGRDVLNLESYERLFPRTNNHLKNPNLRIEASRDSSVVIMNSSSLVDKFMDSSKWVELFPTIVSVARTIEVISSGILGTQSGSLQLIYGDLQVLSPLVPTREFCFLRYCQQMEQGLWAIVDVSHDFPRDGQFASQGRCHRLPSGCLIQDMPNGYSKVTWVEHVEIEDKAPIHRLYRDLIHSGLAFGAERWLATLQRMCERFACLTGTSTRDLGGVIPSADGKRSMMQLAQRMVNSFCTSISTSSSNGHHQQTTLSGLNELGVRVSFRKNTDPGQPNGVVLSAATTIWLPISPQNVFNFFKDERNRPQWDVLSNGNAVQEVAHIANGRHPGNCISVLRAFNTSQNNMLILQESCTDSSGSVVAYCPVDLPSINRAMSGEDPSYIPLLPSGFTISPDGGGGRVEQLGRGGDVEAVAAAVMAASSSSNAQAAGGEMGMGIGMGGSLITVAFQILVSSLPSAKLNMESVATVNNLIGTTVHQIKAALNCSR
ncbi:homeobox-leucine zipper protein HDG11-like isoform X2 [Malania oleifera]|uniref:homeobox-leucine zipper protein HDG11-like isoform X2 n=1 Tax=Malania oleifera TaxID=397392 RepID=UPI0025AEABD8|nr:homeobox-leucine zipper protein HDG11-like isoform X2 [Malania oleifera]